ncbi:hypothetical protein Q9233_017873 [Columba guinea]|nr:hypothetical protein Q9233_017873 [Columba guinea]
MGSHGGGKGRREQEVTSQEAELALGLAELLRSFLPNRVAFADSYPQKAFCGVFDPNGDAFVSACQDQTLRLYRCRGGGMKLLRTFAGRDVGWSILDVVFSPDGSRCFYCSWSDYVHMIDVYGEGDTHTALDLRPRERRFAIFSLAVAPGGGAVLGGANDGCIYGYDLGAMRRVLKATPHWTPRGRVITAELPSLYLVCAYVPNSGRGLVRLAERQRWDRALRAHLTRLDAAKPVLLGGDLNVAYQELDLRHPRANRRSPGFTDEEREGFGELLGGGFIDSFRFLYPGGPQRLHVLDVPGGARGQRNVGWRLDYFVLSRRLQGALCDSKIRNHVLGSDHCPVSLYLAL